MGEQSQGKRPKNPSQKRNGAKQEGKIEGGRERVVWQGTLFTNSLLVANMNKIVRELLGTTRSGSLFATQVT